MKNTPHWPTLGWVLAIVVVLIVAHHIILKRGGSNA
jgi:hypothetical protein